MKAALVDECRLFGIVWPGTRSGQAIYPERIETCTSILIKKKPKRQMPSPNRESSRSDAKYELNNTSGVVRCVKMMDELNLGVSQVVFFRYHLDCDVSFT